MSSVEPVGQRTVRNARHRSPQPQRKACLGAYEVKPGQHPIVVDQCVNPRANHIADSQHYLLYLMPLRKLQFAQVVVQLNHFRRLEVGRLACGRLVVYQAAYLAPVGVEHRYYHTTVANGYLGVFRSPSLAFGVGQRAAELVVHLAAFAHHLLPYVAQRLRRVVVYLTPVVNRLVDCTQQQRVKVDMRRQLAQLRIFLPCPVTPEIFHTVCDSMQRTLEVEQFGQLNQGVPDPKAFKHGGHIYKVLRREAVVKQQNLTELIHLPQVAYNTVAARLKVHIRGHLGGQSVAAFRRHHIFYAVKT